MSKLIDITGQRFGRWTAIGFSHYASGTSYWRCRCDCGNETNVYGRDLRSGRTKSCGCQRHARNWKHGQSVRGELTGAYKSWIAMWQRCTNPKSRAYAKYKDRGVCERWRSFEAFYADMGDRPDGMSIDRIDNSKGYAPENCRWATDEEQRSNR